MSPRREIPDRDRALKALFRVLIQRVGGLDAGAACVRVSRSQLHNYCDMQSDQFAPVDVVAVLEEVAGEPIVTAELARRAQHALLPLAPLGEGELPACMAAFGKEVGESFAAYAEALADGRMSRPEIERLAREMGDVARVAQRATSLLSAMLEKPDVDA